METLIEIYRVILTIYRKHGYEISSIFAEGPIFHKEVKEGYRFILDDYYSGLRYLETPYGRHRLHNSGRSDVLIAIKQEVLEILGQEITHVGGKPVEQTDLWDLERYDDELRKHLHLIYDPENILYRVSMGHGDDIGHDGYEARKYYVDEIEKKHNRMYTIPYSLGFVQMLPDRYKYKQLVGLSVQLYNRI